MAGKKRRQGGGGHECGGHDAAGGLRWLLGPRHPRWCVLAWGLCLVLLVMTAQAQLIHFRGTRRGGAYPISAGGKPYS